MPDRRIHRGPHPEDTKLFGEPCVPVLQQATAEFCWLLDRGYAANSALKLVGDRYQQTQRQRTAIMRCSCTREAAEGRRNRQLAEVNLKGQTVWIDGYNVLTTLEAALSGGVLLLGRDRSVRDMCSMHGTYRKVTETVPAIHLVGEFCARAGTAECVWLLDRPVSNSGRLKSLLQATAESAGWTWHVELVPDPDRMLGASSDIVATADSAILDRCQRWFALAEQIIARQLPTSWIVDLGLKCDELA